MLSGYLKKKDYSTQTLVNFLVPLVPLSRRRRVHIFWCLIFFSNRPFFFLRQSTVSSRVAPTTASSYSILSHVDLSLSLSI